MKIMRNLAIAVVAAGIAVAPASAQAAGPGGADNRAWQDGTSKLRPSVSCYIVFTGGTRRR